MVTEHHLFQTHPHLLAFSTPSKLFHALHHLVNRKSMYWFPPEPSPVWHQQTANLGAGDDAVWPCNGLNPSLLSSYSWHMARWTPRAQSSLFNKKPMWGRYSVEGIGRQGVGVVEGWEQEESQKRWVWHESSNSSHGPRMLTCCDTRPWCGNELTFPSMF